MIKFDTDSVSVAYRKLKRFVYYDKTDLSLRTKLAEFECSPNFHEALSEVETVANDDSPAQTGQFKRWLREIRYRVLPKKLKAHAFAPEPSDLHRNDGGKFISNVTSSSAYEVDQDQVNYFFDGPIELHLLVVLWIMAEGWRLDAELGNECFGSRLDSRVGQPDDKSAALFQKYHERYSRWRDSGLKVAKRLLSEEQTSVCILGLDLQQYYYRVRINFGEVAKGVIVSEDGEADDLGSLFDDAPAKSGLLQCLESICHAYRNIIDPVLMLTHDFGVDDVGLPIGLPSSSLLANWYLRKFDRTVKKKLRPAYYGRYVDDILLVVPSSEDPARRSNDPVGKFITSTLVECGLLRKKEEGRYELVRPRHLFLQQSKCILQYFDAKHSIAGLMKFTKKLEESGSDFRLLPVDEADNSLEDIAYDLLYEGSINKFRSVKGMAENRFELAKHLAKQTMLHLLTDDPPDRLVSMGLLKFFKGQNAIEFHDLWERVFTYFTIAGDFASAKQFAVEVRREIAKLKHIAPAIQRRLRETLELHLENSQIMAGALRIRLSINSEGVAENIRRANLVRHQFVRIPLLDCTDYEGPLTLCTVKSPVKFEIAKARRSARFIAFDELLLLAESGALDINDQLPFRWAEQTYREVHGWDLEGIEISLTDDQQEDQTDE